MLKNKGLHYAWIAVFSLLIVMAPSLMAQTASTGAIKGTVTDASNAVVANATVVATNIGTAATRTVKTGSDGLYIFSLLPLGNYSLKIDAAGFKSETIPSITVNVAETSAVDIVLQVGSQNTSVTVAEQAETVNTTNATLGTVVASDTAVALPLNTRNYTNLLGLSAGASSNVFNATTLGKGTTDIAVNGASINQNSVYMDGVSITNSSSNGNISGNTNDPGIGLVEPDAIETAKSALAKAKAKNVKFLLPVDDVVATPVKTDKLDKKGKAIIEWQNPTTSSDLNVPEGTAGLDIGPATVKAYAAEVAGAKTILWNGPMGLFENKQFAAGTNAVAQAVVDATQKNGAKSIIGGGDSVKAINKAKLGDKVTFMSTGGGASLEFLEGAVLPGVANYADTNPPAGIVS